MKGDHFLCLNPPCGIVFKDIDELSLVWMKATKKSPGQYMNKADAPSWTLLSICPKCGSRKAINIEQRLKELKNRPTKTDQNEAKALKRKLHGG